ncbi:DUF302 domain-containing protein [Pontibacter qinzhouensis]|uniref:DUF302 domain-containing protein n=1 Tax=Pontibacter qinzhouensis TaxID=2603253 RepID=A0A5C8K9R3_9BACT|nr:DUF302 domain-containing protein [Pontibacter qinzhouensis]TXK45853.1 DUF302 domain-containing protein [Pontibacter qinzhouensis]
MSYHLSKKINGSFDVVTTKVKEALQQEGFGVISEIDLKEKFKEKLKVDFRNYKILGACNPRLAHQAIQQEANIGVMLPCNVLLQEHENGEVEVTAINPMETMAAVNNPNLSSLAEEVSQKLKTAINNL